MNIVKMGIHSSREGILTINGNNFTCISDQSIKNGDIILHPQYSKILDGDVFTFVVKDVIEERPSKGDWKTPPPPTWRNVEFKKEKISSKDFIEMGLVRTEIVKEAGKDVKKTFINF